MDTGDDLKALLDRAGQLVRAGDIVEAEKAFRGALDLAERAYGRDAPQVIAPLRGLAYIAANPRSDPGRLVEADAWIRRALRVAEANFGTDDPRLSRLLHSLGINLWTAGALEEASEHLVRAVALSERAHGESRDTAYIMTSLIYVLLEAERPADALPLAERALRIQEAAADSTSGSAVTLALIALGRCLMGVKRNTEAIACMEQAAARILARNPDARSPALGEIRGWIEQMRREP
ncbi:tetratricopeptide repeat protein [Sorangium atrum]|uniref:Tetratricopeptide repeat protein n=1 Tax=Sorangium atrum TaxID=2995308 RepID=A0ABT5CEL2_9BACT|nr:tetratricopeptide repeat protein [Sorangium aterium]MDC0683557.1 tetratricopeptide repeat protein [Sorangium aterium]